MLCIRRTLAHGLPHGLISGLGAATADAIYGMIAAFGLTALSALLTDNIILLRLVGGVFLAYLGLRTLLVKPAEEAASVSSPAGGFIGAYLSVFVLTLTNPMTIFAFLGIFAGSGINDVASSPQQALIVVVGVFIGSALWWLILSGGVSLIGRSITPRWMLWINRLSGTLILLFALRILLQLFTG